MIRVVLLVAAVAAVLGLWTAPALAGHGCQCCGAGGYAYSPGDSSGASVASGAPGTRVYSYQPGTQAVAAPPVVTAPRAYRSYSYSPAGESYTFGIRSAKAKPTFNYAPHRGR
jgi:hypothetical protein